MIRKIHKYFKIELKGENLLIGILCISLGILFLAFDGSYTKSYYKFSSFQGQTLGFFFLFLGVFNLGYFVVCYMKFKLKYKTYFQARKVLFVFFLWLLIIIFAIFSMIKSLMWLGKINFWLFVAYWLYCYLVFVDKFNDSVSDYIENFSLGAIGQDEE